MNLIKPNLNGIFDFKDGERISQYYGEVWLGNGTKITVGYFFPESTKLVFFIKEYRCNCLIIDQGKPFQPSFIEKKLDLLDCKDCLNSNGYDAHRYAHSKYIDIENITDFINQLFGYLDKIYGTYIYEECKEGKDHGK